MFADMIIVQATCVKLRYLYITWTRFLITPHSYCIYVVECYCHQCGNEISKAFFLFCFG